MLSGKIVYIDLNTATISAEEIPLQWRYKYLGGRGINMYLLRRFLRPKINPLSPENPLIIGVGALTGAIGLGAGRVSFSARSPESGNLGDSSMGGDFGPELRFAGFDHLVIKGRSPKPVYLFITNDRVEICNASELWGMETFQTQEAIRQQKRDDKVKVATIGPAGENLVRYACVSAGLKSMAGRTGMGTVMGSKNLKAIAVRGTQDLDVAKPKELLEYYGQLVKELKASKWIQALGNYGTPIILPRSNEYGLILTRNHQDPTMIAQVAEKLGPEHVNKYSRGMSACFGCPVACRHRSFINEGKFASKGEGPEYSALIGLGANLGLFDINAIIHAYHLCNKYGLDVISLGSYIGWAMELYQRGILTERDVGYPLDWGNSDSVIRLIDEIAHRRGWGDVLAEGVWASGRMPKGADKYLLKVKNLPILGSDERAFKSLAFGIATASRGADHLRSRPAIDLMNLPVELLNSIYGGQQSSDCTSYQGKARMIWWMELLFAVTDALGFCKFQTVFSTPHGPKYEEYSQLLKLVTDLDILPEKLLEAGERIYTTERLILRELGLSREDDTLPNRYFDEPVDVPKERGAVINRNDFQSMLDEYYQLHGWDFQGTPTERTLRALDIQGRKLL